MRSTVTDHCERSGTRIEIQIDDVFNEIKPTGGVMIASGAGNSNIDFVVLGHDEGEIHPRWKRIGITFSVASTVFSMHLILISSLLALIASLVTILIVSFTVLRASNEGCERIFRLLRWIADRPEHPLL